MKKTQNEKDNEVQIDETHNNLNLDINFNCDEDVPPTYEEIMENGEIDWNISSPHFIRKNQKKLPLINNFI